MPKSKLSETVFLHAVDLNETPGAPTIKMFDQTNDSVAFVDVIAPLSNEDGSPLTDLKSITVVVAETTVGDDPFAGMSSDEAATLPGAQVLTKAVTEPSGEITLTPFAVEIDHVYAAVAFASDE